MSVPELDEFTAEDVAELVAGLTPEQVIQLVTDLPAGVADVLLAQLGESGQVVPEDPAALAPALVEGFVMRPHLSYLFNVLERAVRDVEDGRSRRIVVEMPPRMGKTMTVSQVLPAWVLAHHPDWPIALTSFDGQLATSWGRAIRRWAEAGSLGPAVQVARDAGAVGTWETTRGGSVISRSRGEGLTGRGAKVLVIDDPHKDFMDAHSAVQRETVWQWWLNVAQTRLQGATLVVVVMTRWHEDDLVGRLLSPDYPGDPADWEVVRLPALADSPNDLLGRAPGAPLLSPLEDEDEEQAVQRWERVRRAVGSYTFSALYQQAPAPPSGSLFHMDHWRYWTDDPARADGERIVYVPPERFDRARWVDSWDMAFKGADTSDFVVGQRWCREGADRFLVAQARGRWTFTQTIDRMLAWSDGLGPYGHLVHQRLVEDAANGTAIVDTLRSRVSGLKPIRARISKEARARIVSPEIESGNVYLPLPSAPGNGWVADLLSELRQFPNDAHDDQVDALTQALGHLRDAGKGSATVPRGVIRRTVQGQMGRSGPPAQARRATAARIPRR